MNKNLLNQLPDDEQPVASKLDSVAEDMKLSPSFQWDLENRLMNAYQTKTKPLRGWHTRIVPALGWGVLLLGASFLLNWTIRSQAPDLPPAAPPTAAPEHSFADAVRQGTICADPLAVTHGFTVSLTNENKSGFLPLDPDQTITELRSFAWSPDGELLALIGNDAGRAAILLTDPDGGQVDDLLSGSQIGYLRDAAWSPDGTQMVLWSSQNNRTLYLIDIAGSVSREIPLELQVIGTPQFTPEGESVVFYGANAEAASLFELKLDTSQITVINPSVEDDSGFVFSPDGSRLAYMEYDRDQGEARLVTADRATGERAILGTLPIPQGSGSALPETAHLDWSPDGETLTFDFGRYEVDHAVYLAYADGSGLIKVVDSAHAPTVSADGRCLAYISDRQVFLMDLRSLSSGSMTEGSILVADLSSGRGGADFKLDQLQWRP